MRSISFLPGLALALLLSLSARAETPPRSFEYGWAHPAPQANPIFGLCFADDQQGWAVARGGTILHTLDGGDSWQIQRQWSPDYEDLVDIVRLDDGTLVACGSAGHVALSSDDGHSWQRVQTSASGMLRDLALRPDGAVSATGEGGVVLVSTDGGHSWTDVGPGVGIGHHHVWKDALEGYLVGMELAHRTVDGGASWTEVVPPPFLGLEEVLLVDSDSVVLLSGGGHWRSDDGGSTWTQTTRFTLPFYMIGATMLGPQHWVGISHGEGGRIFETVDGGANWNELLFRDCVGFTAIERLPGGRLVVASDIGDLLISDDDGATFDNRSDNLFGEGVFASIAAFVSRPDGTLFTINRPPHIGTPTWLRSDDGGVSWTRPANAPQAHGIGDGVFVDDDLGLVLGLQTLSRTTDGGQSWQEVALPTTSGSGHAVDFVSRNQIYLTMNHSGGGALWRSRDEGLSWQRVTQGVPSSFVAGGLALREDGIGLCGGSDGGRGVIYRTTDGGESWSAGTRGAPTPLSITWADATRAFAVDGSSVWRSLDEGRSWHEVDEQVGSVVRFADAQHGIVAGRAATLRVTDDGGESWRDVDPPLASSLLERSVYDWITAVAPVPEGWLLGGQQSRILLADVALAVAAPSTTPQTAGVRIESVRPNPFNPRLTVSFSLNRAGVRRADVFDSRGRRVRAFAPRHRPAGTHELRWDGRDDAGRPVASGVYHVRIRCRQEVDTARVVLAK